MPKIHRQHPDTGLRPVGKRPRISQLLARRQSRLEAEEATDLRVSRSRMEHTNGEGSPVPATPAPTATAAAANHNDAPLATTIPVVKMGERQSGAKEHRSGASNRHNSSMSNPNRPRRHSPAVPPAVQPAPVTPAPTTTTSTAAATTTTTTPSTTCPSGPPLSSNERRSTRQSPPSGRKSNRGGSSGSTEKGLLPPLTLKRTSSGITSSVSSTPASQLKVLPPPPSPPSIAEITPLSNSKNSRSSSSAPSSNTSSREVANSSSAAAAAAESTPKVSGTPSSTPSTAKSKKRPPPKRPASHSSPVAPSSVMDEPDLGDDLRSSKRMRLQHQPFQSPASLGLIPAMLRKKAPAQADDKILVFSRGDFLAVRNENGGFFVCRTAQNVYKSSKRFKIQWMNNDKKPELYTPDFYDHTDFECILTNLRMRRVDKNKYLLPKEEQQRTENILQRALNVENGMDVPDLLVVTKDGVDVSIVGKEEEEEADAAGRIASSSSGGSKGSTSGSSPSKKNSPKASSGGKSSSRSQSSASAASRAAAAAAAAAARGRGRPRKASDKIMRPPDRGKRPSNKSAVMKVRAKAREMARGKQKTYNLARGRGRPSAGPAVKRAPVQTLKPNPKVIVFEKDPTFETNLPIPFISTAAHSRLLIRAVLLSDSNLLHALLSDVRNVCSLTVPRSLNVTQDALGYAVLREDHGMIKALLSAKERNYAKPPCVLLPEESCGRSNYNMFGHHMRAVGVSRGGREGNNAMLKDIHSYGMSYPGGSTTVIQQALRTGVSRDTLHVLCDSKNRPNHTPYSLYSSIVEAIRNGHHRLAGQLVREGLKKGGFGFNLLHQEVLLNEKQPLTKFRPQSVIKKATENARVTPLHCAAINPNPEYLSRLLGACPYPQLPDKNGWQPIHYAAVCKGSGPLQLLLSRGLGLNEFDNEGNSPLHLACRMGRLHNVDLILKHLSSAASSNHHSGGGTKDGGGGGGTLKDIDSHNKNSYTPLLLAADNGHTAVVRLLLRQKADPEKRLSAAQDKLTPLMLGSRKGHFQVVSVLVEHGAQVEAKDKRLRTALTHAIIDGHAHVASYLLRLGANPNGTDNSGNTLVHYAAAYGWYFCLKLLAEAGSQLNTSNDWKLTPLSVAFMKGHIGLVDFLISQPGVDINVNVSTQDGKTLLIQAVSSQLNPSMLERIRFLVEKLKCDCTLTDNEGNNALHHLVYAEASHRKCLLTEVDQDKEDSSLVDGVAAEATLTLGAEDQLSLPEEERFQAERQQELDAIAEKVCSLLLSNGCPANALNNRKESPFSLAVKKGSLVLLKEFLRSGCTLMFQPVAVPPATPTPALAPAPAPTPAESDKVKEEEEGEKPSPAPSQPFESILHSLVEQASKKDVSPTLQAILASPPNEEGSSPQDVLAKMGRSYDPDGYTPLLSAIKLFSECKCPEGLDRLISLIRYLLEELDSDVTAPYKSSKGEVSALHLAASCSDRVVIDLLLARKPPLNPLDPDGCTPLVLAITKGCSETAEALVLAGADVNVPSPSKYGYLPALLLAAKRPGMLRVVSVLARHTANVQMVNPQDGNNALHYVASHGSNTQDALSAATALVTCGVEVTSVNQQQQTPLHLAVEANLGDTNATFVLEEFLLKKGARTDAQDAFGRLPLHYPFLKFKNPLDGSHSDPIEMVTLLVSQMGAGPVDVPDRSGLTALHCAATRGATICCMHLCQRMKNVDVKDSRGNTPLGLAVLNGHEGCALMLLQQRASCILDVTVPKKESNNNKAWKWKYLDTSETPKPHSILQEAVMKDWQGVLFLMLDQLEGSGKGQTLAIEAALQCQKYQLALKLISRVKHGWTLYSEKHSMLHTLAMEARPGVEDQLQVKVAQALMDKGVPAMARDEHGCSVLTYAATNWNHTLCQFFTTLMGIPGVVKADPDKWSRTPFSALFWQLGVDHEMPQAIWPWCLSLLQSGADPNILTAYPVRDSPYPGVPSVREPSPATPLPSGTSKISPLIMAVCTANYPAAKVLLTNGADVNFPDEKQRTPLMHAARINDMKMLKLLLNYRYNPDEESTAFSDSTLRKTSDADLGCQDAEGWTVIHHLVAPLPSFSYASPHVLRLLFRLGAPLDTAAKDGATPLKLAASRGAIHMVKAIQQLLETSPEQKVPLTVEGFASLSQEAVPWDFKQDAQVVIQRVKAEDKSQDQEPKMPVDKHAGMTASQGEVVIDEALGVPLDALLTMVDLNYGHLGMYNFYKMQLVYIREQDLYILVTRWGRVGDEGQHQKSPFSTMEEARKEFAKIFKSKTGNSWDHVKNFQAQPKKYRLVRLEHRRNVVPARIRHELKRRVPSKLSKGLENLIWELVDEKQMQLSMDECRVPSGALYSLSEESLTQAQTILKDILQLLKSKDPSEPVLSNPQIMSRLVDMSEEFYQLVPVEGYQYERLPPILNASDVHSKLNLVHSLLHIGIASQLFLAAQLRAPEVNPTDYIYQCLQCSIERLSPDTHESQMLLQYIHNTGGSCVPEVKCIYRLDRHGESERLAKCAQNISGEDSGGRALLFHGTRNANLLGILAKGLLISPPDAMVTGDDMFGKGLYFADMLETSLCFSHRYQSKHFFVLICEVALGKTKNVYGDARNMSPEDCDSLKALGRKEPNPLSTITWRGVDVPLGKPVDLSESLYQEHEENHYLLPANEFVVHRPLQVCLRYLVQFQGSGT